MTLISILLRSMRDSLQVATSNQCHTAALYSQMSISHLLLTGYIAAEHMNSSSRHHFLDFQIQIPKKIGNRLYSQNQKSNVFHKKKASRKHNLLVNLSCCTLFQRSIYESVIYALPLLPFSWGWEEENEEKSEVSSAEYTEMILSVAPAASITFRGWNTNDEMGPILCPRNPSWWVIFPTWLPLKVRILINCAWDPMASKGAHGWTVIDVIGILV